MVPLSFSAYAISWLIFGLKGISLAGTSFLQENLTQAINLYCDVGNINDAGLCSMALKRGSINTLLFSIDIIS